MKSLAVGGWVGRCQAAGRDCPRPPFMLATGASAVCDQLRWPKAADGVEGQKALLSQASTNQSGQTPAIPDNRNVTAAWNGTETHNHLDQQATIESATPPAPGEFQGWHLDGPPGWPPQDKST
jgi:hypothetical protein